MSSRKPEGDATTRHYRGNAPNEEASTLKMPDLPPEDLPAEGAPAVTEASIHEFEERLADHRAGEGAPDPLLGALVGPFRVESFLGAGGMGRVYRARDTRLGRPVALKFLREEDPESVRRLMREAQALARLDHTHVCRIFDVGEWQGKVFIAMQFINGVPLSRVAPDLYLEQKLWLIKEVADGLAAAHKLGLVHRDVKPGNILLEKTSTGEWKPYLMDFGLARQAGEHGLSVTGDVMGTPMYMAPEQASGNIHAIDQRSDVYSLGATLYELLAGRPLYEPDGPVAVLANVISSDPASLRRVNRRIPEDLETIVMKCLEREPGRRYASADLLQADLERFLKGDPILARKAGLAYRLLKKVQKNKAVSAVVAVSVFLLATLAVFWLHWAARLERQTALAKTFDQEIRYLENKTLYLLEQPVHDIRAEMAGLRGFLNRIRARMAMEGTVAMGPGHYAIGRAFLVLGNPEAARKNLQAAWEKYGFQTPETALCLGLALMTLYEAEGRRIQGLDPALQEKAARQAREEMRDPAVAFLSRGRELFSDSPEYMEALLAWLDGRLPEALKLAEVSLARFPWQPKTRKLIANIHYALGRNCLEKGDLEGERTHLDATEHCLLEVTRKYPCDVEAHTLLSLVAFSRMEDALKAGDVAEAQRHLADAEAQRRICTTVDLGNIEGVRWATLAEFFMAEHQFQQQGKTSDPAFDSGVKWASWIVAGFPDNPLGCVYLGGFYQIKAHAVMTVDPEEAFNCLEKAVSALRQASALAGNNEDYGISTQLGNVYLGRARLQLARGEDPLPAYELSVRAYATALHYEQDSAQIHFNRGVVLSEKGLAALNRGGSPDADLSAAAQELETARRQDARILNGLYSLCINTRRRVQARLLAGKDPQAEFDDLARWTTQAVKDKEDVEQVCNQRCLALIDLGWAESARGRPVQPVLEGIGETLQAWQKAVPQPQRDMLAGARLRFGFLRAAAEIAAGQSPELSLRQVVECARGMGETLGVTMADLVMAKVERFRGEWAQREGRPAARNFARAKALLAGVGAGARLDDLALRDAEMAALTVCQARAEKNPARRAALAAEARQAFSRLLTTRRTLSLEYGSLLREAQAAERP